MNPLKAKRSYLKQENSKYGPTLTEVPRADWPEFCKTMEYQPSRVFRSRHYLALFYGLEDHCSGRLSVCRTELNSEGGWKDGMTWDDMQELKRQAGFEDAWAVEVFPPASEVVNVANFRHLWLVDPPAFAWRAST